VSAFDVDSGRQQGTLSTSQTLSLSAPAVADETVYLGDRDAVHALNSTLGQVLWVTKLGSYTRTSPVVTDDSVYVGCDDGVYALQANHADRLFTTQAAVTSLCVADGTVYLGDEDWTVYAVDASSGTQQWSREISGAPRSVVVENGSIYTGTFAGLGPGTPGLHAIDADTGRLRWHKEHPTTSASVVDDTVVTCGDGVCGFDVESGATRWQFTDIQETQPPISVSDGTAYFGEVLTGQLYGLNVSSGAVSWTSEIDEPTITSVSVGDGIGFVGTADHSLYAVELDGHKL
jgi:FOG: WD40-like repeat